MPNLTKRGLGTAANIANQPVPAACDNCLMAAAGGGGVQSAPIFGTSPTPHQHQDIPEIIPGLIKEHGGGTPPQNATHTHTHTQKIMACRFIQDPGT